MRRMIIFTILVSTVALSVPHWNEQFAKEPAPGSDKDILQSWIKVAVSQHGTTPVGSSSSRSVHLKPGPDGHFRGQFRINGRKIQGLIDTGATSIAINETTARRLGVQPAQLDFNWPIMTANGQIKGARTVLRRVELGNIRINDVDAIVLKDNALQSTLIGMSFLNRVESYKVERGTLKIDG